MTASFLAWSYSRLKQFLDCPAQLYHNAVAPKGHPDRVEYRQSQAMLDGNLVDDALTKRISAGVALPSQYAPYEPMAQIVLASPGHKFTQMKIALDQALRPVGYTDWDHAWVRVIYDVAVVNGTHAWLGDWKNGQIRVDNDQLRLFATVGFHYFPELETAETSYIWLKHGLTTDDTFQRRELADLWNTFLPDVERMQTAWRTGHWPAEPKRGASTCKYCPANGAGVCKKAQGVYGGN